MNRAVTPYSGTTLRYSLRIPTWSVKVYSRVLRLQREPVVLNRTWGWSLISGTPLTPAMVTLRRMQVERSTSINLQYSSDYVHASKTWIPIGNQARFKRSQWPSCCSMTISEDCDMQHLRTHTAFSLQRSSCLEPMPMMAAWPLPLVLPNFNNQLTQNKSFLTNQNLAKPHHNPNQTQLVCTLSSPHLSPKLIYLNKPKPSWTSPQPEPTSPHLTQPHCNQLITQPNPIQHYTNLTKLKLGRLENKYVNASNDSYFFACFLLW